MEKKDGEAMEARLAEIQRLTRAEEFADLTRIPPPSRSSQPGPGP